MKKSKNREYLDKDRELIFFLFDYRCLMCGKVTNVAIHEIIPISHGKRSLHWKNRVLLCNIHHEWAHGIGTNNSIPILQEKRKEFLIRKFGLNDSLQAEENVQEDRT